MWPFHALQVVEKSLGQAKPAGAKVSKKVVVVKRLETLNIARRGCYRPGRSGCQKTGLETDAAALAADSRPKRTTKLPKKLAD